MEAEKTRKREEQLQLQAEKARIEQLEQVNTKFFDPAVLNYVDNFQVETIDFIKGNELVFGRSTLINKNPLKRTLEYKTPLSYTEFLQWRENFW